MTTMDEKYGDGAKCLACNECGLCIEHGDCRADGCGKEVGKPDERSKSELNSLLVGSNYHEAVAPIIEYATEISLHEPKRAKDIFEILERLTKVLFD